MHISGISAGRSGLYPRRTNWTRAGMAQIEAHTAAGQLFGYWYAQNWKRYKKKKKRTRRLIELDSQWAGPYLYVAGRDHGWESLSVETQRGLIRVINRMIRADTEASGFVHVQIRFSQQAIGTLARNDERTTFSRQTRAYSRWVPPTCYSIKMKRFF